MTGDLTRVRSAMMAFPWAMDEAYFDLMVAVIMERRLNEGIKLGREAVAAIARGGSDEPNGLLQAFAMDGDLAAAEDLHISIAMLAGANGGSAPSGSQVGLINVFGPIAQHASSVQGTSGPTGTSAETVGQSVDAAIADPSIKALVMNYNSPGGSVYGIQELGQKIAAAAAKKPIIAQVSGLCASAAYWLATQCSEIVVQPSGEVGSIGVIGAHEDHSEADKKAGIQKTIISAGKYKAEGALPLTDEAKEAMEARMASYYSAFTTMVAKGRSAALESAVSPAEVRAGYGQGRLVNAADAKSQGMIDRIGTLEQTMARVGRAKSVTAMPAAIAPAAAPDAFDGLPILRDAAYTAMMIKREEDGRTCIVGDWPAKTAFPRSLIGTDLYPFMSRYGSTGIVLKFEGMGREAVYSAIGRDSQNPDLLVCALVSGNQPKADSESEAKAKAEAARFRRIKYRQELESLS